MLNYIWIGLLFLGIGAAVTTDIINKSDNRYKSGVPYNATIIFDKPLSQNSGKTKGTIQSDKEYFNIFFNAAIKDRIALPITIFNKPEANKEFSFSIITDSNSPEILKEIASSSGDKKDIIGKIKFFNSVNDSSAQAQLFFEEVSFLKIKDVTNAALDYAGTAVNIALGLIGIMALWLGIMKIAETAGLITIIGNWLKPITKRLFPEVPSDHPAMGSMIMNISANMLGLGNAATPFGLKAMEELDKLNPNKGTATNSMVTFLAINTAGMTLIPASAIAIRAASGSSDPTVIIGTSLFGSLCATTAGIISAKLLQNFSFKFADLKIWFRNNIKLFISLLLIAVLIFITAKSGILKSSFNSAAGLKSFIQMFSIMAIPLLILLFVGYGAIKKVKVYEVFVEGAKEGFNIAIRIIPYLVAMLVAIGIFRAGGAMTWLIAVLNPITSFIGMPAEALPMALMRPLSGSGSLGIMAEIMNVHGPDSFIGVLVSTFYGSTETTFYVLAVYFGAVNIKNIRHALPVGLIADICGILGALFIVKLLFG